MEFTLHFGHIIYCIEYRTLCNGRWTCFRLGFLDFGDEFGHGVKNVLRKAIIGDREDGCVGILVDGNDDLAVLHAGKVLAQAKILGVPAAVIRDN